MAPYFMAFISAILFSLSSLAFSHYSKKVSAIWMNTTKAAIACAGFLLTVCVFYEWHALSDISFLAFVSSGVFGLGCADVFLFLAFTRIGPARTLMLFGFAPLINGVISYWAFDQEISPRKLLAIFFMILCLLIFSYEGQKKNGQWELKGLLFALSGVCLDSVGICLSRFAFNQSPQVIALEGNFYRTIGALAVLFVLMYLQKEKLWVPFQKMNLKNRLIVCSASFAGTFLSLWLFLTAIQVGHLATVSSIAVTAPFWAALFEHIYSKEWPSQYLLFAFVPFLSGAYILFS